MVFSQGLTHDFGPNLEISSHFVFWRKCLEIMFDDQRVRKLAFLDYKHIDVTQCLNKNYCLFFIKWENNFF